MMWVHFQKTLNIGINRYNMAIPGGLEVFLVPALFLLAFLGLAAKYLLKWFRQGYEDESGESARNRS